MDHKPLLKIFGDRSLDEISNARLRNLKEKTLGYRFRLVHIPGVKHRAADAISRHPTGEPVKMDLPDDVASLQDDILSADLPTLAELRTSFLAGIRSGEVFEDTTELPVQYSGLPMVAVRGRGVLYDPEEVCQDMAGYLCCGDGLGRWRPCRRCALSYKRACSRWVRCLLVIAEFAGNCMIAEKAQHIQVEELRALVVLRDGALKHQFVLSVHEEWLRREPRWLLLRS